MYGSLQHYWTYHKTHLAFIGPAIGTLIEVDFYFMLPPYNDLMLLDVNMLVICTVFIFLQGEL